jgi:hypothetical protein
MTTSPTTSSSSTKEDWNQLRASGVQLRQEGKPLPAKLKAYVDGTLMQQRASPPSPKADRIAEHWWKAYQSNEATGMDLLAPHLLLDGDDGDSEGHGSIINRELHINFNDRHLPPLLLSNLPFPTLAKPRPDNCIGYATFQSMQDSGKEHRAAFTKMEELHFINDAPTSAVHFPFLTSEAKSEMIGGNIAKAEMQCARTGACLVKYLTSSYTNSGIEHNLLDTSHLSVAHTGSEVQIHIHWSSSEDGHTTYWMQSIFGTRFANQQQVKEYRQIMRNHETV